MNQHAPFPSASSACALLAGHVFSVRAPRPQGGEVIARIVISADERLVEFEVSPPVLSLTLEEMAELRLLEFFIDARDEKGSLAPLLDDLRRALPEGSLSERLLSAVWQEILRGEGEASALAAGRVQAAA